MLQSSKRRMNCVLVTVSLLLGGALSALAAPTTASITVQMDQPGIQVPSTLHGLFFEDINYGADGGLYGELVQNRSFEHRDALYAWTELVRGAAAGQISICNEAPLNATNPHFLRIAVKNAADGGVGAVNSGFDSIALQEGDSYLLSIYARRHAGEKAVLKIQLENASGRILAADTINEIGTTWKKYELKLRCVATEPKAKLVVLATQPGAVDVDMISLFPEKTFKGRRNGLRADLAQALADIKPGFLRFPGGCIVEGKDVNNMYRWKDTIGDVAERKENWNVWQDRVSPQYSQTYGLGFFEYFQFAEDIGAEPLPIINCGMTCQARQGLPVPLDQLDPYVQDALDLIEFANGSVTSKWGAKRAAMGHPKPFNLKFLGVGNEQWLQEYFDRYAVFYKALKAKYPAIQLITTAGPQPNDGLWQFAWDKFKSGTPADIVDEHYYRPPQWFLEQNGRYDTYDRKGPKIFVGEYAAHEPKRTNTLRSAIAEAAFATSLWRNADVVSMASYAPLLANINHTQWGPDLIWFDNARISLTPNYYVQAMLSQNRPDNVVPVKVVAPQVQPPPITGRIGVGTWLTQSEFKDVTVTRNGEVLFKSEFSNNNLDWDLFSGDWSIIDGALRQTSGDENCRVFIGDISWTDYTLSLKARKLGGSEGFLISFGGRDGENITWNMGGWGNTQHGLDVPGAVDAFVPGKIETGRWYDIRVEIKGASVKCFLDDKLVQQADSKPTSTLFASAGRDKKTNEIIVAVANASDTPQTASVNLTGIKAIKPNAQAIVLTSAQPGDENTLNKPNRIKPTKEAVTLSGPQFERTFPAWSFTVLRITP